MSRALANWQKFHEYWFTKYSSPILIVYYSDLVANRSRFVDVARFLGFNLEHLSNRFGQSHIFLIVIAPHFSLHNRLSSLHLICTTIPCLNSLMSASGTSRAAGHMMLNWVTTLHRLTLLYWYLVDWRLRWESILKRVLILIGGTQTQTIAGSMITFRTLLHHPRHPLILK